MDFIGVVHGANPQKAHAQNRADGAIKLYRNGIITKIISTGKYEAEPLAERMIDARVSEADIIIENRSRSSYENFLYLRELLDTHPDLQGQRLSYLISQSWHRDRIYLLATGILREERFVFYPVPDGRDGEEIKSEVKAEKVKYFFDLVSLRMPGSFGHRFNNFALWVSTNLISRKSQLGREY